MKVTVTVNISGSTAKEAIALEFDRTGPVKASTLGLTLGEAKTMLRQLQREIVEAQIAEHLQAERICRECGSCRSVKDRHTVRFKSLFGGVGVLIPRLKACSCSDSTSHAKTIAIEGMVNWVAPELEYVQARLAADLPFARAARILAELLPVNAGGSTSTTRRRTLAVGERLETQVREMNTEAEPECGTRSGRVVAMGLDSGFIRDCRPRSERSFEVVVGRILGPTDAPTRSLGFVGTIETSEQSRQRIRCRVTQEGATTERLSVFTDGDESLRRLQIDVLPNATHVLDWFHLTRRLTVLKNVLRGQEAVKKIPPHYHQSLELGLKSLKWRLSHGQYARALNKLHELLSTMRLPSIRSKPPARRLRILARTYCCRFAPRWWTAAWPAILSVGILAFVALRLGLRLRLMQREIPTSESLRSPSPDAGPRRPTAHSSSPS